MQVDSDRTITWPAAYNYDESEQTGHLTLDKKESADAFFDDGLVYIFRDSNGNLSNDSKVQPTHLSLEVRIDREGREDGEACDVRLYSIIAKEESASSEEGSEEPSEDSEPSNDAGNNRESLIPSVDPEGNLIREDKSDIVFFRFGWFNYMKLNTESMLHEITPNIWYTINMIIDYET